ncbi:MAG: 50S ribosomal protein L23 [bacterium]|nr:50S ribosomal protein L23 [bacterium]
MNRALKCQPLLTEKSLNLSQKGWYTFIVDGNGRKPEIARDIERMYAVNVLEIRTVSMHGKIRRSGKKMQKRKKPDWKKALVFLKSGQTIPAFQTTSDSEKK